MSLPSGAPATERLLQPRPDRHTQAWGQQSRLAAGSSKRAQLGGWSLLHLVSPPPAGSPRLNHLVTAAEVSRVSLMDKHLQLLPLAKSRHVAMLRVSVRGVWGGGGELPTVWTRNIGPLVVITTISPSVQGLLCGHHSTEQGVLNLKAPEVIPSSL